MAQVRSDNMCTDAIVPSHEGSSRACRLYSRQSLTDHSGAAHPGSGGIGLYTHRHLQAFDCYPFVRWMKRTRSTNLVSYGESSTSEDEGLHEEDGNETTLPKKRPKWSSTSPPPPPPPAAAATDTKQRKRQLPALAAHLASSVPLDDPSKHQGRTRTTPHVDGQWAAYVYVPIAVRGTLRRIVERAVDIARKGEGDSGTCVDVHMLGSSDENVACELHVSLTRPCFLRAHQREEMKRAVRDVAKARPP